MIEIEKISDIQTLLMNGFEDWQTLGNVSVKAQGDLRIFNYTAKATYSEDWNYFEIVSRGLILNAVTGEIVARPFDKFFNWGQGERFTNSSIKSVTQKLDGSLGILYREGYFRIPGKIATRGSFDSEQAIWATKFLKRYNLSGLPYELTLLFEIIYPDNRIVIDYHGKEDLVLLGIRNRFTGEYYPWQETEILGRRYGFSLPKVYNYFDTPEQLIDGTKILNSNEEGWVVEFEDGQRFKFKGEKYFRLHRLITGLSFKNTLKCMAEGTLDELLEIAPDEFLDEVKYWISMIELTSKITIDQVNRIFNQAPKNTRKDFAIWVTTNHKELSPYLFAKLDGRPIEPLIYKRAFND